MTTIQNFTGYSPTWCPGCGNHGIGIGIKSALVQLNLTPSDVFMVFGIGCSGNMNDFLNVYAIHSLHGRSIPTAIGVKIANHKAKVIVIAGDGDCLGEGGNHFLHAARGNHDITIIIHDNSVYGLTTGQAAPTAQKGYKSKSTPAGIIETPINPLTLAISQKATFVAQAFAGDVNHLISIIKLAINHKGFSLVNVLQPCVTFNKINTYEYYRTKTYKLTEDYQKNDFNKALIKATESDNEKFPLGVIYQINKPTYTDQLPQLKEKVLIQKDRFTNFDEIIKEFV